MVGKKLVCNNGHQSEHLYHNQFRFWAVFPFCLLCFGSFHVKQAKIKQKCHPGSRISKLIFFVDSTFNSKKKSHITFFSKTSPFWSRLFWTLRQFLGQKQVKFTKWPPKMSRHQILISNETLFYVKLSKFSIFNSFEEIGIHLHTVFLNITSM
jgi:hypothetical protein